MIDVGLPGLSGFVLAELAANVSTPVLLMSDHPDAIERLERFGFPFLSKPFDLQALITEATWAMAHSRENICCVMEAVAQMRADVQGLNDAIATSHQLAEASRQLIDSATEERAA